MPCRAAPLREIDTRAAHVHLAKRAHPPLPTLCAGPKLVGGRREAGRRGKRGSEALLAEVMSGPAMEEAARQYRAAEQLEPTKPAGASSEGSAGAEGGGRGGGGLRLMGGVISAIFSGVFAAAQCAHRPRRAPRAPRATAHASLATPPS
jgi:hypothetical protein